MTKANPDSLSSSQLQTRVRAARAEDLAQLTEVLASSFYSQQGWLGWLYPVLKLGISEDLRQRLRTEKGLLARSHSPRYVCLAAIRQELPPQMAALVYSDCVTGTIELSQRQAFPWQTRQSQHLYLSNLAVHSKFRRQGIAQQLLKACEQVASDWGFSDLYLHVMEDNLQARHLYHKVGFRLVPSAEMTLSWWRSPRRLLMHKPLTPEKPAAVTTKPSNTSV